MCSLVNKSEIFGIKSTWDKVNFVNAREIDQLVFEIFSRCSESYVNHKDVSSILSCFSSRSDVCKVKESKDVKAIYRAVMQIGRQKYGFDFIIRSI